MPFQIRRIWSLIFKVEHTFFWINKKAKKRFFFLVIYMYIRVWWCERRIWTFLGRTCFFCPYTTYSHIYNLNYIHKRLRLPGAVHFSILHKWAKMRAAALRRHRTSCAEETINFFNLRQKYAKPFGGFCIAAAGSRMYIWFWWTHTTHMEHYGNLLWPGCGGGAACTNDVTVTQTGCNRWCIHEVRRYASRLIYEIL